MSAATEALDALKAACEEVSSQMDAVEGAQTDRQDALATARDAMRATMAEVSAAVTKIREACALHHIDTDEVQGIDDALTELDWTVSSFGDAADAAHEVAGLDQVPAVTETSDEPEAGRALQW